MRLVEDYWPGLVMFCLTIMLIMVAEEYSVEPEADLNDNGISHMELGEIVSEVMSERAWRRMQENKCDEVVLVAYNTYVWSDYYCYKAYKHLIEENRNEID